jgi:predicted PurR-regulated permease PerM
MLQNKIGALKLFTILLLIVVLQSFFQNTTELTRIFGTFINYFSPFIYGVFFAILLQPLSVFLENKLKISRVFALIGAVIIVFISIVILVASILPGLNDSFSEIFTKLPEYKEKMNILNNQIMDFLTEKKILNKNLLEGKDTLKTTVDSFFKANIGTLKKIAISFSSNILNIALFLGKLGLGFILAIFLIIDKEYFQKLIFNIAYLIVGKEKATITVKFLDDVRKIFLNYLWGKTLSSFAVGIIVFIVMYLANVPYAGLISVMLGIGNMIPYVGATFAGIIGGILIMISDPSKIWWLIIANILAQNIEGFYLAPKIIGKTVGLGSFWVLIGVMLGGAIMGPIGMIFGVPVVAVIKLIYTTFLKKKQNEIIVENIQKK